MRKEIKNMLEEINFRVKALKLIDEGEKIDVESIKPGSRRLYRVVVRNLEDGNIVPATYWLTSNELKATLKMAIWFLRLATSRLN